MARLQRAQLVFYSTEAVRQAAVDCRLVPEERLVYAPYGYSGAFTHDGPAAVRAQPYLLHVGSCITRKRIDLRRQSGSCSRPGSARGS